MFADDEECDSSNAVRYAVLPSLVALQQMRNRLHLAFVGKKLMTWTATATARELRKMALELNEAYQTFRDDMRQCFILLARARYFNPEINKIVLENLCKDAGIKIQKTSKSIAGVKVLQSHILDYGFDSYEFLGIGRGGTAINEAKKAWRDLLKRMIFMCQMRCGFTDVEQANKNATKRRNVISKVVLPRVKVTSKYILDELEEKEREDTFRLKRFKELKTKRERRRELTTKSTKNTSDTASSKIKKSSILRAPGLVKHPKLVEPDKPPEESKRAIKQQIESSMAEKSIPEIPKNITEICQCAKTELDTTEDELGYIEKKYEEIVKVTRSQYIDGTINETKQIITIKTENRKINDIDNNKTPESTRKVGKYHGTCSGGYDVAGAPTETKSEQSYQSHQMAGPTLRTCMSTSSLKSKEPSNSYLCSCSTSEQIEISSKSSPVCTSRDVSKILDGSPRKLNFKSVSIQTSSLDVPTKQPFETSWVFAGCLPCNNKFGIKKGKVPLSVDAVKRIIDTINLSTRTICESSKNTNPIRPYTSCPNLPPRKFSAPTANKSLVINCSPSKNSGLISDNTSYMKSEDCMTIKIKAIPKCKCKKTKMDQKEVAGKPSLFQVIKNFLLPPTKSNIKISQINNQQNSEEIKGEPESVSKICQSKKSKSKDSKTPSIKSSSCKISEDNTSSHKEIEIKSASRNSSYGSVSSKSIAIGPSCASLKRPSKSEHSVGQDTTKDTSVSPKKSVSKSESTKSVYTRKNTKDVATSTHKTYTRKDYSFANTTSKKSMYHTECTKDFSVCPNMPICQLGSSSTTTVPKTKDAATSTKKSAKFDVRPLSSIQCCQKKELQRSCKSDTHMVGPQEEGYPPPPIHHCRSYNEDKHKKFKKF